jgi:predicted dehydrogenase
VRVLFCGLGGIGQRHLRNLRALLPGGQLDVHAYRVLGRTRKLRDDLSIESGHDLVADYDITVHADLDAALASRPEAVFICNPSSLHTRIALQAARAGAHLFIEKPVSHTLEGVDELLTLVQQKQLVCHVGYNFRFHPALQRIKALLEQGHFGRPLTVRSEIGEYLPNWHRYEDYRTMYASRADLGGGVVLSQIHEMDLIYWYFGMPVSVYSLGGHLSHLEIDVEDTASSLMQYDGPLGRFPISLHQDYLQRPPVRSFKIVGDRGVATADLIRHQLTVHDADGAVVEHMDGAGFNRNDMFRGQMQHFLRCLVGHESPTVSLHAAVQSLRMALAARESLQQGTVVHFTKEIVE